MGLGVEHSLVAQILTSAVKGLTTALGSEDCAAIRLEASHALVLTATPVMEELALLLTAEPWQLQHKGQRAAPKQRVGPRLHLVAILAIDWEEIAQECVKMMDLGLEHSPIAQVRCITISPSRDVIHEKVRPTSDK
jgi:hypothetical protein